MHASAMLVPGATPREVGSGRYGTFGPGCTTALTLGTFAPSVNEAAYIDTILGREA